MAKLICKYTPVYVDMNGRVYIGREIERTQIFELPNTSIIDMPPTNLCKTQTSGFVFNRPPFGCNNVNSPTPTSDTDEKGIRKVQTVANVIIKGRTAAILQLIKDLSASVLNAVKGYSHGLSYVANVGADVAVGRSFPRAAKGNLAGAVVSTGAGAFTRFGADKLIAYLASSPGRLAFAGRWGGKGRNLAITLIGAGVAYLVYPLVHDPIVDGPPPKSGRDVPYDWIFLEFFGGGAP